MAEAAVSFVLQQLYQLAKEEIILLKDLGNGLSEIKDQLESINAILKDADRRAGDEEGETNEGVKAWVKQVREISFRIEDVIDEYRMYVVAHGTISVQKIHHLFKSLKARHRIASEIQDIKFAVRAIKERSIRYNFRSSREYLSSWNYSDFCQRDRLMASHFTEETEVVGFEFPSNELIRSLIEGADQLSVISVVGMGGIGKTTLAKLVYNNLKVKEHFDCRSFITVHESYIVREILIDTIQKFHDDADKPLPKELHMMDDHSLIAEVRQYLQSKRYLVVFDDVWKEDFFTDIKYAMPNNNNGSRIIITSRMTGVAHYFKNSYLVHVHHLQPLPEDTAFELFCKKAFKFENSEQCPIELRDLSREIVRKIQGLPLAIVTIGGLLSTKQKTMDEWTKVCLLMRLEFERNAHFTSLMKIWFLSYDDLPLNLKSCMLYFAMFPEDYSINCKRLIRLWLAEGFIKNEGTRPMEDVAEDCLIELIHRSLVQVSRVGFDGKVKNCQINSILRDFLIRKTRGLSFCHTVHKDDELDTVGMTRRFSIATCSDNVLRKTSNTGIRTIFVFDKSGLPEHFVGKLAAKFKLLKVLDFKSTLLNYVPDNLGKLFQLRYLNLSNTKVEFLPRSIGKLLNLETLDLRQTNVRELPVEINNLTKLRLLPVYYKKHRGQSSVSDFTIGVKMHKGIGCLKSLRKLYLLEADHGGLDLIKELQMLKQLRKLGIRRVKTEYATTLSIAIGEMNHLESLNVSAIAEDEIIDLNFALSAQPELKVLNLNTSVTRLPDWIPKLVYLVKLRLGFSNLKEDPLDSLKDLPNLLWLSMWDDAYAGESLHFKEGGFPKLKELDFTRLSRLNSVSIDNGALLGLQRVRFKDNPQMKVVPHGLKHLLNLQFLGFDDMPTELVESIDPDKGGEDYLVIKHIPQLSIRKLFSVPTSASV